MHGNNHPQGKRTVILMVVLCVFLHLLLIPVWMGLVFAEAHAPRSFLDGPMYSKVVTCDTFDNMSERMVKDSQFPLMWMEGKSLRPSGSKLDSTFVIAFDNLKEKWTVLETFTSEAGVLIACILGEGSTRLNINPDVLTRQPGTNL